MKSEAGSVLRSLAAVVLAGAATGGRSFTGVTTLAVTAPEGSGRLPDRVLARPVVKALLCLAAAGEYVADKLPMTPSRLAPFGLSTRTVAATASGWILARRTASQDDDGGVAGRETMQILACAALATGSALTAAWLGSRWRRWAEPRLGNDLLPAVVEDLVVVGIAAAAAKLAE